MQTFLSEVTIERLPPSCRRAQKVKTRRVRADSFCDRRPNACDEVKSLANVNLRCRVWLATGAYRPGAGARASEGQTLTTRPKTVEEMTDEEIVAILNEALREQAIAVAEDIAVAKLWRA